MVDHKSLTLSFSENSIFNAIQGHVDVRVLFSHKHCGAVEFAHCNDESFISTDIGKENIFFSHIYGLTVNTNKIWKNILVRVGEWVV